MFHSDLAVLGAWLALGATVGLAGTEPDSTAPVPLAAVTAAVLPGAAPGVASGAGRTVASPAGGWRSLQASLGGRG